MKFNLEPPYFNAYRYGYLQTNPENRQTLILYNSHNDRTSVSYARYLMAVNVGWFLNENEEVDHIDGDKTNDDIANLQILTREEHRTKTNLELAKKARRFNLVCSNCGKQFRRRWVNNNKSFFCSRICYDTYCGDKTKTKGNRKLTDSLILKILELHTLGLSSYKIANAYTRNNFNQAVDGLLPSADNTIGILPTVDRLRIGCEGGVSTAAFLCGTIAKLAYYPYRLSNAQLQALKGQQVCGGVDI